jgi:menaquinone-dependent protoporphyrinogen oxidase
MKDRAFFGGELALKKLNLPEKLIVKGLKAPIGDFRDWDTIESWAAVIAATLEDSEYNAAG